jgi:hypothetical protein
LWIRVIGTLSYLLMSLISTLGQFLSFKVFISFVFLFLCCWFLKFWCLCGWLYEFCTQDDICYAVKKRKKNWYMLSTFVWFKIAQLVFAHWHRHVTDTNTAHWH